MSEHGSTNDHGGDNAGIQGDLVKIFQDLLFKRIAPDEATNSAQATGASPQLIEEICSEIFGEQADGRDGTEREPDQGGIDEQRDNSLSPEEAARALKELLGKA